VLAQTPQIDSITPGAVAQLPEAIRVLVTGAYNDALTPVFLWLIPLLAIAFVLLAFVEEHPLKQGAMPGARRGRSRR
jgi:hypothetical protein